MGQSVGGLHVMSSLQFFDASTVSAIKDVVLGALAVYGAVLSTINWRQSSQREKRSIRVTMSTVMPALGGELGSPFARITATNSGHRSVTITTIALELPSGERIFAMNQFRTPGLDDTRLPVAIADGQSAQVHLSYSGIGGALIESGRASGRLLVTPVCEDSVGGVYKGEAWDVDPAEFARMS